MNLYVILLNNRTIVDVNSSQVFTDRRSAEQERDYFALHYPEETYTVARLTPVK